MKGHDIKNNRIKELFQSKQDRILSIYFCAGHPKEETCCHILETLQNKGIDMVEIGIPFSDPIADGKTIQNATTKAIRNGMSLKKLFNELNDIRTTIHIPIILMGYLNTIVHYGFEKFCISCVKCGIDGVIIPDLPFKEYIKEYKAISDKYGIKVIMMITPETEDKRIRLIDEHTDGFIYMVSSASTTGEQSSFNKNTLEYFEHINKMHLNNPCIIGFGISNKNTLESAYKYASGAVIGSKFVSNLEKYKYVDKSLDILLHNLKE